MALAEKKKRMARTSQEGWPDADCGVFIWPVFLPGFLIRERKRKDGSAQAESGGRGSRADMPCATGGASERDIRREIPHFADSVRNDGNYGRCRDGVERCSIPRRRTRSGLRGLRRRGLENFLNRRVLQDSGKGWVGFRGVHVLIAFVAGFAEIDDATFQVAGLGEGFCEQKVEAPAVSVDGPILNDRPHPGTGLVKRLRIELQDLVEGSDGFFVLLVGKVSVSKVHVERGKIILDADSPFVSPDGLGIFFPLVPHGADIVHGIGIVRVQLRRFFVALLRRVQLHLVVQSNPQFIPVDRILWLLLGQLAKEHFRGGKLFADQIEFCHIFGGKWGRLSGRSRGAGRGGRSVWSGLSTRGGEKRTEQKSNAWNRQEIPDHGESPLSRTGLSGSFFFLPPKIPKIFCKGPFFFSVALVSVAGGVPSCAPLFLSGCSAVEFGSPGVCGDLGEPPPKRCDRKDPAADTGP